MSTRVDSLFNIALLPISNAASEKFISAAKPYSDTADGYLLGHDALPHVTLSHFRAADESEARQAFANWKDKTDLSVTLTNIRIKPGIEQHANTWWPEIETTRDPKLLALQKSCYVRLTSFGLIALNKPEVYRPHFTLARCRKELVHPVSNPDDLPIGLIIPCTVALGQSSENGVFLKVLETTR